MIEIKGAYNTAIIYSDAVEADAMDQIRTLCDQKFVTGSKIRIMPDVHLGAGCTIGTTMTITDKIVPNLVGVDIGCGMEVIRTAERNFDPARLDAVIAMKIPSGFSIREKPHPFAEEIDLESLRCKKWVDLGRARKSIGTLGGGNHFIEADRDSEGGLYIVVHSGSRDLGLEVAGFYQGAAVKSASIRGEDIPKSLAYVSGESFDDYLHDMKLVQRYADLNRKAMVQEIAASLQLEILERFTTIHNYIDTDRMILRKGAVSAMKGEKLLIPLNMADGSLICIGKGNAEWNYSAPHGAGRLMSRKQAKKTFTLQQFEKAMAGIYSTTVSRATLDEIPLAYKPINEITANIGETADIVKRLLPIYNFKAED